MNDINPFVFGKAAEGEYFTDRSEDAKRLNANLTHGINTILISPRRWGKTSLVKKVISEITNPNIKPIYIDIFQCKSEYEFYHAFASTIIKQTSSKLEEWAEMAKTFLSRVSPKFSFGPDPMSDFSLSFDWNPKDDSDLEILQLPEKIAKEKNIRLVVCIDEFQQIGNFPDSIEVQKRIRGVWQLQKEVSYCLYGSKKHMLTDLFQNKRMPFYQFGDIRFLQPIALADWIPFIRGKFEEKGQSISDEQITRICETVEYQSSYVQQLAWNVMLCCDKVVDEAAMTEALDDLIGQNSTLFLQQTEGLSSYQMNFLKALAAGETGDFTSAAILKKYNLGSKSNISRLTDTLIKKELIEKTGRTVTIADPVFRLWMRTQLS